MHIDGRDAKLWERNSLSRREPFDYALSKKIYHGEPGGHGDLIPIDGLVKSGTAVCIFTHLKNGNMWSTRAWLYNDGQQFLLGVLRLFQPDPV